MRKSSWKRVIWWIPALGVLMQTPACTDTLIGLTAASSVVTAGGLLYLISRVLE